MPALFGILYVPTYLSDKIEKVQKRAFRIIYPEVEYTHALRISQCKRLSERRQDICEQTFKKIQDPDCKLNYILPLLRSNKHDRELRNSSHYCLPRCRTERYKKFIALFLKCAQLSTASNSSFYILLTYVITFLLYTSLIASYCSLLYLFILIVVNIKQLLNEVEQDMRNYYIDSHRILSIL